MTLIIVHYHFRPGGIRRVIELATLHLLRKLPQIDSVLLVSGEAADAAWNKNFIRLVAPAKVQFLTRPEFGYTSEQRRSAPELRRRLRQSLAELFATTNDPSLVWAHNLGIGRNLPLSDELARACAAQNIRLISHHHDWWFDNRWVRWPEIRQLGYPTLTAVAQAIFPDSPHVQHATINSEDADILQPRLKTAAAWLPNPIARHTRPSAKAVAAAHRWLARELGEHSAPAWILPCRLLRRKNIAEALLLTRWLRPEAWLVTTGGVSSADEKAYYQKLNQAAQQDRWRLRLGVLQGSTGNRPDVPALLAASEAVLLTSIQEGFGLPYLEAAAAERPLIARELPNIAPDLAQFGFRFPQSYSEILIHPALFDQQAERLRQQKIFARWRQSLPATLRARAERPAMLRAETATGGMPFSRLTLTAQLEVLRAPVAHSWALCAPLNPFLTKWRQRAQQQKLQVTRWPRSADQWLSETSYAQRFAAFVAAAPNQNSFPAAKIQTAFLEKKLCATNMYPLLWTTES